MWVICHSAQVPCCPGLPLITPIPPHACPLSSPRHAERSEADFNKPLSTPQPPLDELLATLSAEALDCYVDLGPYSNPSYYVVQEDASLSKVHQLFRALGLRHVCVVPR